jgi:putative tryptophan/tyrosine transport system substrate-binding protein
MRRRAFIAGLVCTAATSRAEAQQAGKVYRIAIAHPSYPASEMNETSGRLPWFPAFFAELRRLGYVEGQNLRVERYSAEGQTTQYADLAREVVSRRPDVILTGKNSMVLLLKAATPTVPIVGITADPVAAGIVPSLARPGGNITGVSVHAGLEVWGKRLELLKQAIPGLSRVGFLADRDLWDSLYGAAIREAAQRAGLNFVGPLLHGSLQEPEYRRVILAIADAGAQALLASDQSENIANRELISELATAARLPAMYAYPEFVSSGGLMAYGVKLSEVYRGAAGQIDQILRGTKPGEIPYQQATKFLFVINLKTAKTLGLDIPANVLARADEVIE